jgi:predicted nucleic acid-binding protein
MNKPLFLDTSYVLALLNTRDELHHQALFKEKGERRKEKGTFSCSKVVGWVERSETHLIKARVGCVLRTINPYKLI